LRERQREKEGERASMSRGETQGEADFPLSQEPDMELDPRTQRS